MKTWKLGLFFVVSLMLVMGVLAENTFGHNVGARGTLTTNSMGTLRVDASKVNANEEVDLTITYTATETIADPTDPGEPATATPEVDEVTSEGRISIALPSNWGATDADGLHEITKVTAHNGAVIKKVNHDDDTATASVNFDTTDGQTIVVDLTKMESGDYIKVVIKGSELGGLAAFTAVTPNSSLTAMITVLADEIAATFTPDISTTPENEFENYVAPNLTTTLTTGNAHPPRTYAGDLDRAGMLSLDLAMLGIVKLAASKVTAGEKIDLTVTYTATEVMGVTDLSGSFESHCLWIGVLVLMMRLRLTVLPLLDLVAGSGVVAEELRTGDITLAMRY